MGVAAQYMSAVAAEHSLSCTHPVRRSTFRCQNDATCTHVSPVVSESEGMPVTLKILQPQY